MNDVAEAVFAADASAGALLRRAREAGGLHVAALAVSLKVPVRKLEALEEDRFDDLGDAVFIRGLASSVCRTLKIDPQPVLDRLPQTSAPRLVRDTDGLNAPFRAPNDAAPPSWIVAVRQPVPLTVLALLVGVAAIALLPTRGHDEPPATAASTSAVAEPSAPEPSVAASEPQPPMTVAAVAVAVPAVAAPSAAVASAPASASASALAVVSSSALPPAPAPVPASGIVVVRAKGESWVEVVDAKGVVAVRKLMAPGEAAGASGALPLSVTVGRVDMTEVEVRGKKFDMHPVSKDNVAHFEVK